MFSKLVLMVLLVVSTADAGRFKKVMEEARLKTNIEIYGTVDPAGDMVREVQQILKEAGK